MSRSQNLLVCGGRRCHPDKDGSTEEFLRLNEASGGLWLVGPYDKLWFALKPGPDNFPVTKKGKHTHISNLRVKEDKSLDRDVFLVNVGRSPRIRSYDHWRPMFYQQLYCLLGSVVFSQHLIRLGIGRKSVSHRILPLRNLYYRNIALENAVIWLACAAGEWYPAGKDRRATAGKTVGPFFHGAQSTPQISPNFVAQCCAVGYPQHPWRNLLVLRHLSTHLEIKKLCHSRWLDDFMGVWLPQYNRAPP